MSTTFGIKTKTYTNQFDDLEEVIIPVAKRSNGIRWTNDIAPLLSDDTPVIAMDNTPQGIFTIGDIKRNIKDSAKPVLGLMPLNIHIAMRRDAVKAAIDRYLDADLEVPTEWMDEYNKLMLKRKHK